MISDLFQPWRATRTWWALTHVLLSLVVGSITFSIVFTLLVTTIGLLITFPLALPVAWLLFVVAAGLGVIERTRVATLLDLDLTPPYPPLEPGSWWSHLKQRVTSGGRWREIAYLVLLLPIGAVTFALTAIAWCGSLALVGLPFYAGALPGGTAKFGLFEVGPGAGAIGLGLAGVVGLALLAPWATVLLARLEATFARWLLGPPRRDALEARVEQLDASRTAALDSAEAERRRIERDLHDGAQQRLVALGMELGRAREQYPDDPDLAMHLVADAHEEAKAALAELRDLVRGFHPAILEDRGLDAALSSVVARSPVPVTLEVDVTRRPSAPIESTAYFVVTEALANVAKHAGATRATVTIARRPGRLLVEVADDGRGGASPDGGTGLVGLAERVAALGGHMQIVSPPGGPTNLIVEIPCAS